MTIWYLDSEKGSDKNDGLTPETALKSLKKVVPGDTVLFLPGAVVLIDSGTIISGVNFIGLDNRS